MDIEQLRDYCLSLPHSSEGMPFGDGCIVYKVVDRVFAIMAPDGGEPRLSLKCDPDRAEDLRAAYPAIIPGYHLNKKHWNTVLLESLPEALIKEMIQHSYDQVLAKVPKKEREVLIS